MVQRTPKVDGINIMMLGNPWRVARQGNPGRSIRDLIGVSGNRLLPEASPGVGAAVASHGLLGWECLVALETLEGGALWLASASNLLLFHHAFIPHHGGRARG
uniref:Uncharacterized protein n=1 Tax=Triticum urartu TaxID=4572 RepID=A0A8R7R2W5_TRIUA